MGRMGGTETIVATATSKSPSLRTTIPIFIVKQIGLKEGDHLNWELDKVSGVWIMKVVKKEK